MNFDVRFFFLRKKSLMIMLIMIVSILSAYVIIDIYFIDRMTLLPLKIYFLNIEVLFLFGRLQQIMK